MLNDDGVVFICEADVDYVAERPTFDIKSKGLRHQLELRSQSFLDLKRELDLLNLIIDYDGVEKINVNSGKIINYGYIIKAKRKI